MGEKWPAARRMLLSAAATAFAMWLLLYAPSPYVVYEPGIAVPVEPMVALADTNAHADDDEEKPGTFVLTAVRLTDPNLWGVIRAGADRNKDVRWKQDVFGGRSKTQYVERLNAVMSGSQEAAVQAAYSYAGVPFHVDKGMAVPERADKRLRIHADEIGGPSAGLVFALQGVDLLTEGDLAQGLRIAATGTIDAHGKVGAIGGVKQKAVAVSRENVDLFLVPQANESEARRTSGRMEGGPAVVGVETLDEAVRAIADFATAGRG
ncbi:S16 family serine protease [Paenibacillus sp. LHD-117]|uniref:S16 family serine protease n=1 Tax=Paenibacillus sp. LHD-117 TaxID=3071412 RepID=UPI0027E0DA70|nr:S16 family serine protease [Paenibacillus sp. LHD-117]MDQ6419301.1 S16 family serine protease [Paenibacillus sp. LHD-117]